MTDEYREQIARLIYDDVPIEVPVDSTADAIMSEVVAPLVRERDAWKTLAERWERTVLPYTAQIEAERDRLRDQLARAVVLPAGWQRQLWTNVQRGHNHMYPGFDNVSMTELVAGLVIKAVESWQAPVDAPKRPLTARVKIDPHAATRALDDQGGAS